MLELRIAFRPWLLFLTILVEAGNRSPGPICCHLPSLGVEKRGKRVLLSKNRTIALQIIARDPVLIHPLAQTLVADELHNPNGLINRCVLPLVAVQFVLVDEHGSFFFLPGVLC
jgi:hypothetical protein